MTEMTLHTTPRWRDVVLEQIRIVGLSARRGALLALVLLGIGTFSIVSEILSGGRGFDSKETFPTPFISVIFAYTVWSGEKRFGPALLWTLPVDRRRMALAKVLAGWVWMMAWLAFFVSWLMMLALLAHASPVQQAMRVPWTLTTATYLLGSALVLGLRHPLRWLFGTAGVLLVMGRLGDVLSHPDDREWQNVPGARAFFSAVEQAAPVWQTLPDLAQWTIIAFLSLGAGLAALWAAASRHRETRRH